MTLEPVVLTNISDFRIPRAGEQAALDALRSRFPFIPNTLTGRRRLPDALLYLGALLKAQDEFSDFTRIEWVGSEHLDKIDDVLYILAPFVTAGSKLIFMDFMETIRRYDFDGKSFRLTAVRISYDVTTGGM